jgi:hypothetical protein
MITTDVPAEFVIDLIVSADPVVPPLIVDKTCVVEDVILLLVIVKVKVAPPAMEGVVMVTVPDLAFIVAAVVPVAVEAISAKGAQFDVVTP